MCGDIRIIILWIRHHALSVFSIRLGRIHVMLDASWWLMAPVSLWAVAVIYIPIMGAVLPGWQVWAIAVVILALIFFSVLLHSLAHIAAAKVSASPSDGIFLGPLGDPAHFNPAAPDTGKEALVALAGPMMQGVLAVLSYLVWTLQVDQFLNIVTFFFTFFNLGLMAINLIPAFPFDGGRILRAVIWRIFGRPGLATRLALRLGWGLAAGLIIWGILLIAQPARFSLETGAACFILSALILISLALRRGWEWNRPETVTHSGTLALIVRTSLAVLLLLPLVAITFAIIPLNEGLEAPGFTASVEPMVQMPSQYRHTSTGSLILTTVIPQAPILAGEWVYAHLDRSIKLEPEEQIVPQNQTVQSVSLENYQMLQSSQTTAVIVGLRLAGYPVDINDGVSIVSILPQSPAAGVLQPGDVINGINGQPVTSLTDLTHQLGLLTPGSIVNLRIERSGQTRDVSVPVMKPIQAGGPVRIGISVVPHHSNFSLPFPIRIVPQKVVGGPSAGLMFTLGVYDLVTGLNLTGGRIIAGTGTIGLDGNVGPIGGVQQKVVAAERAGAQYFLCPPANYQAALEIANNIKVIKVATAQDAINFLRSLPPLKTGGN